MLPSERDNGGVEDWLAADESELLLDHDDQLLRDAIDDQVCMAESMTGRWEEAP